MITHGAVLSVGCLVLSALCKNIPTLEAIIISSITMGYCACERILVIWTEERPNQLIDRLQNRGRGLVLTLGFTAFGSVPVLLSINEPTLVPLDQSPSVAGSVSLPRCGLALDNRACSAGFDDCATTDAVAHACDGPEMLFWLASVFSKCRTKPAPTMWPVGAIGNTSIP